MPAESIFNLAVDMRIIVVQKNNAIPSTIYHIYMLADGKKLSSDVNENNSKG